MAASMSGLLERGNDKSLLSKNKARWFEVIGSSLNYYKSKGEPIEGTIDLRTANEVLPLTKSSQKGFSFELRTTDQTHLLIAPTQADQETWVAHLRDCISTLAHGTGSASPESEKEGRRRGRAVGVADVANGHEPPVVPSKPSSMTLPSKTGPPPPVPDKNAPPKVPPKKTAVPLPPSSGAKSASTDGANAKASGAKPLNQSAPSKITAQPPATNGTSSTVGATPGATKLARPPPRPPAPGNQKQPPATAAPSTSTPHPPATRQMPSPPPVTLIAASDGEPIGPFQRRRNSSLRATTGDLAAFASHAPASEPHSAYTPARGHVSVSPSPAPSNPQGALSPRASTVPTPAATPTTTNAEKRSKTAKELLQTEKYYVDCLHSLQQDFMQPLMESAKQQGEVHTEADVRSMFSNILPMIIPVNEELLVGLEKRMGDTWDANKTLVGDVFAGIAPFLKMYLDYSRNYQSAIETYNKLKDNAVFSGKLAVYKERSKVKLALEHLLIMPVQRIPRYLLLLGELKKETGSDHPDRPLLEKAITLVEDVANHINEQMKRLEVGSKALAYPELVAPHRYLMWEGTIETRYEKEKEEAKFVLFNDMLLHHAAKKATKGSKWHLQPENMCSIQLVWTTPTTVTVKESSSTIGPIEAIDLLMPAKRMTVVATTVEERNFLKALREAMQRQHGAEHAPLDREAEHMFSDEAIYRGCWRDGKPHGQGTMEYTGIATYTGGWFQGQKQGHGVMAWVSGNTYDGVWLADLPHGEGTFTWPNRDVYTGSFVEGLKSGRGIFKWASGASYDGQWVNDKPSGTGHYSSPTESYEGTWLDGLFHGSGTLREKLTGRVYEGTWSFGAREGTGTCRYGDNSEYTGNWKRNRREGKGTYTSRLGKNIETYTGEWSDDRKNGAGVMSLADGTLYDGTFKDDLRHGKGKLKFADNDPGIRMKYEGEFEADRLTGKGTLWFSNGDVFEGSFKDNAFHGQGTFQYAGSIKLEGKWTAGQLEGKGSISQMLSPQDKKPTSITGAFSHGSFARSKDSTTKFDIPVAPASTTMNITRL